MQERVVCPDSSNSSLFWTSFLTMVYTLYSVLFTSDLINTNSCHCYAAWQMRTTTHSNLSGDNVDGGCCGRDGNFVAPDTWEQNAQD